MGLVEVPAKSMAAVQGTSALAAPYVLRASTAAVCGTYVYVVPDVTVDILFNMLLVPSLRTALV
jgi:hypothetical protein